MNPYVLIIVIIGSFSGDIKPVVQTPSLEVCEAARSELLKVEVIKPAKLICVPGTIK